MTILQINKFYFPKGGADLIMLELSKMLESRGHRVVPFAMDHPLNFQTPYAHSFVSRVDAERVTFSWQGIRTAGRMLFSFEAKHKLYKLIRITKPDVAHLHNIYQQISPSVFIALRKTNTPTVLTVHDWALLSPSYNLFDHGEICERGVKYIWQIIQHRCIKNSLVASLWAAFVFAVHKKLNLYDRNIDFYVAPSTFVKDKLVESGFRGEKIEVVPHYVETKNVSPVFGGDYVAYVGRLSPEKGVKVLIEAAREIPNIPIKIAGRGPEEKNLKDFVAKENIKNIEFVGRLDGVALSAFYKKSAFVVVPSLWYEIFGLVVIEAYAHGKPVLASRIGTLPEIVREGETGALFEPGNARELAAKIAELWGNNEEIIKNGQRARLVAETEYSPDLNYERTLALYDKAIMKRKGKLIV